MSERLKERLLGWGRRIDFGFLVVLAIGLLAIWPFVSLASLPVEVLPGHRVIEVRAAGVNKGTYVSRVTQDVEPDALVLCAGDDRTDHDMYRALPPGAVSIHIGAGAAEATYSMESPGRLRDLLRRLADGFAPAAKLGV